MNIQTTLRKATEQLKKSASPALDAEILLTMALKKRREWLLANPNYQISKARLIKFQNLITRRVAGEPAAYLTGRKEFFGLDFKVNKNVLVPRPETETLVELALQTACLAGRRANYILPTAIIDIGTGSGCIIISLAKSLPRKKLKFIAIDASAKALTVARENARQLGVTGKIKFLRGHLLEPLYPLSFSPLARKRLKGGGNLLSPLFGNMKLEIRNSLLVGNLPYLTPKQYHGNPDLRHEPKNALIAGRDGLKYFRQLFALLAKSQTRNVIVLLEHDPGQKLKLQKLIKQYFSTAEAVFSKDLSGRNRVVKFSI